MARIALMVVVASISMVFAGCAVTRENQRACKASATVVGVLVGGAAAGVGVGEGTHNSDAGAGAGAGGAVLGGLVGWALGNHFCQVPEGPPVALAATPPAAPSKRIETLAGPSFDFNKSTLTAEGRAHVDHAAQVMRDNPTLRVSVDGYTDSIGSDAYNMKLSKRRADSVRDYLQSHGIRANRMTTQGFGETHPVATNETAEGRAENRRVEIVAQ